ncbi:MAG: hypothetical protein EAZ76_07995 [Nostocales cyanobacterium]|nr:MAG: hypothetical protein EAZ87_21315 [Nostocales cyanobacterium]TAF16114.1 MAG: hypothetical protein EAZ76_07995 [Nostocales cyanobacterium]
MADAVVQYIEMKGGGSSFKYAWHAVSYGSIAAKLGIKVAKPTEQGLVFGANSPKPPEIRISYYKQGNKGDTGSTTRFCALDKLDDVLNGSIRGQQIKIGTKSFVIANVSLAG